MKKLILSIILLLCLYHGYSQTQKETIQWIQSKIIKEGNIKDRSEGLLGIMSIKVTLKNNGFISTTHYSGNHPDSFTYKVDLTKVIAYSEAKLPDGGSSIEIYVSEKSVEFEDSITNIKSDRAEIILDWGYEQNLYERFKVALTNLIKQNKLLLPKEAF